MTTDQQCKYINECNYKISVERNSKICKCLGYCSQQINTVPVYIGSEKGLHQILLMTLAGAMTEGGVAQVFINAGKPVNTDQVKSLVRECLAEKIRTMLGTREVLDRSGGDVTVPQTRHPIRDEQDQAGGDANKREIPDAKPKMVNIFLISISKNVR